jgi:hypothetical protein
MGTMGLLFVGGHGAALIHAPVLPTVAILVVLESTGRESVKVEQVGSI